MTHRHLFRRHTSFRLIGTSVLLRLSIIAGLVSIAWPMFGTTMAMARRIADLPQIAVDPSTQEKLRLVAAATVSTFPPRQWCPGM